MKQILTSGLLYFAVVFGVGFVLGPIRVLVLVPRVGERSAELMELPIMLAAIIAAARWVIARLAVHPSTGMRLGIGGIALFLTVMAELGVLVWVRDLTLAQYIAQRDPVAGSAYVASLVLFALMPALVRRSA